MSGDELRQNRLKQLRAFDQALSQDVSMLAGVDEAGRGPLAGPVVAAAVIVKNPNFESRIDDSKKLSALQRQKAFDEILTHCHIGCATVEQPRIDEINILRASLEAMSMALKRLAVKPSLCVVDGTHRPDVPYPVKQVVSGDSESLAIACASIVAKVMRDRMMDAYHEIYPGYGFDRNRGYGTEEHMKALFTLGASPIHRRSFEPVRLVLETGTYAPASAS